jgi:hypothetical protein
LTTGAGATVAGQSLRRHAERVLREDDAGAYTVPSRLTYPHQWNWDSALCALGWAELDAGRAWTELETLAGARDREGMVPHIAFSAPRRYRLPGADAPRVAIAYARYSPGPRWWGRRISADGRRITALTQPPLAATCMRLLFERHPDESRARRLLPAFAAWHRFLLDVRDPERLGEPVVIHPWESGRDNAVEWDVPLWRVVPEVVVLRRPDERSVDPAERPSDDHYRRYLTLVRRGTRVGWPQAKLARSGQFRVLDPGFSAILARACMDLSSLAAALGEPRRAEEQRAAGERVAAALRARADGDALIRPFDLVARAPLPVTGAGSALALLTPGIGDRELEAGVRPGSQRDAWLALRGPLARPEGPSPRAAQLLAGAGVGECHLARRGRARRARERWRRPHPPRADARGGEGGRDARVLPARLGQGARRPGLRLDGGAYPARAARVSASITA